MILFCSFLCRYQPAVISIPDWANGTPGGMSVVRGEGVSCPTESWFTPHLVRDASCGWRMQSMTRIASTAKNVSIGDTTFMENIDPVEETLWERAKNP